jgi:hypothetical protein
MIELAVLLATTVVGCKALARLLCVSHVVVVALRSHLSAERVCNGPNSRPRQTGADRINTGD